MTQLPKACSLTPSEGAARGAELRELARRALRSRERAGDELLLRFEAAPGVREQVEDLASRERECCPFLELQVHEQGELVTLAIGAAPEDRAALDSFYELAAG